VIRVDGRIPFFIAATTRDTQWSTGFVPKIMDQRLDLP
jgi:hypothetical protein